MRKRQITIPPDNTPPRVRTHPVIRHLLVSLSPCLLVFSLLLSPARAENYPLLEELNRQTQSLYRDVQSGLVRVQLPVPRWVRAAAAEDDPLKKWNAVVDPAVKAELEKHRERSIQGKAGRIGISITPSTQPADAPPALQQRVNAGEAPRDLGGFTYTRSADGEVILESRGDTGSSMSIAIHAGGDVAANGHLNMGGPLRLKPHAAAGFAPNNIGLLLDDKGHILIPLYVDRESFGDAPVRVMIQDTETTATFVGSDEKTQVTILKLEKPVGRPVRLAHARPENGALVMMLNPANGAGRLALWGGGEKDYGVVVSMDGAVAGIVRFGQFLGGPAAQPVVEQLIQVGSIQRAILGARLTEIRPDDPARRAIPQLADLPALAIDDIAPGSLAESAGLRRGDFILQLGDEPVGDLTTWSALSARGGHTNLLILRNGVRHTLTINLEPSPAPGRE